MPKPLLLCLAVCLAAAADTAPAQPGVRLDLQAFEQPMSASGWHFYAWSRPTDNIAAAVLAEGDNNKAVKIEAVDKGAAGIASKGYAIDAADTAWRVTLRVKASADYANNNPWIFLAANGKDGFLPPAVNLTPAVKATKEWTTVTLTVTRAMLPEGALRVSFNLATASVKDKTPAGALFIDDVVIEALR